MAAININTATREELEQLDGIGAARAGVILVRREEGRLTADDLKQMPEIPARVWEQLLAGNLLTFEEDEGDISPIGSASGLDNTYPLLDSKRREEDLRHQVASLAIEKEKISLMLQRERMAAEAERWEIEREKLELEKEKQEWEREKGKKRQEATHPKQPIAGGAAAYPPPILEHQEWRSHQARSENTISTAIKAELPVTGASLAPTTFGNQHLPPRHHPSSVPSTGAISQPLVSSVTTQNYQQEELANMLPSAQLPQWVTMATTHLQHFIGL